MSVRMPSSKVLLTISGLLIFVALSFGERLVSRFTSAVTLSDQQKQWCLATCGVLTRINNDRFDVLGGGDTSDKQINGNMRSLQNSWGIKDKRTLMQSLKWLERGGDREEFDRMGARISAADPDQIERLYEVYERDPNQTHRVDIMLTHYVGLGDKGLLGWDYSRYVNLCSKGYAVGYLTEDQAWNLILPIAKTLQNTFDSWEDLGANYLIGREYWSLEYTTSEGDEFQDALDWLCAAPDSPWVTLPWDLDLTPGESP